MNFSKDMLLAGTQQSHATAAGREMREGDLGCTDGSCIGGTRRGMLRCPAWAILVDSGAVVSGGDPGAAGGG